MNNKNGFGPIITFMDSYLDIRDSLQGAWERQKSKQLYYCAKCRTRRMHQVIQMPGRQRISEDLKLSEDEESSLGLTGQTVVSKRTAEETLVGSIWLQEFPFLGGGTLVSHGHRGREPRHHPRQKESQPWDLEHLSP